jgi:short-subunit dehydrogenase
VAWTVLVTGGSSGIGYELAKRFARDGHRLVLVARDEERLARAAVELEALGERPACIASDLAEPSAPFEIARRLEEAGRTIDVLVNNAGFGLHGPFADADVEAVLGLVRVNVLALTCLTRLLLPGMLDRGQGRVLNVASTAAYFPGPFMAVYYASKAYVLSFSEGLASELRDTGVRVTALCPPATDTGFAARAGASGTRLFRSGVLDAATVADAGYRGLLRGRTVVVPGLYARLQTFSARLMPRGVLANVVRRLHVEA